VVGAVVGRCALNFTITFFINVITALFYHYFLSVTCCGLTTRLSNKRHTHTQEVAHTSNHIDIWALNHAET